ncbi:MAG: aspartate ammonia-lyase [Bacteroidetes bacterium]|nr:aspartate ammonia-lyase [Bacteroidota bacterium]
MRNEQDFIGKVSIPSEALYGIHSFRARENFPNQQSFPEAWYRATGTVKLACYRTVKKLLEAVSKEHPDLEEHLRIPDRKILGALELAATEVASGSHFEHFIVPATQGGAGTSINMNINEIISNTALVSLGKGPGNYLVIDPIENANIYQSTNDVIPTALTVASMQLLNILEEEVNLSRFSMEQLESRYRNSLRLGYTQMQAAVPSTYGQLFSTYSEALSRDWWRVSKTFERIKVVNLGGGATGTGISIPRFYIMEVVPVLKNLTKLPLTQGENLPDTTANMDKWVEVHAILKAHAVNMEKIVSDLRLLSAGAAGQREVKLPARQVGSSIMPGKINPVIPEYLVSSAHRIYANDHLITSLSGQGCLELNAYLPEIGCAMLESLNLLISMNKALRESLLGGLEIDEEMARKNLFMSPAVTTALSPLIGYHRAAELAGEMKKSGSSIFDANKKLELLDRNKLEKLMEPGQLLKQGFTMNDIREVI